MCESLPEPGIIAAHVRSFDAYASAIARSQQSRDGIDAEPFVAREAAGNDRRLLRVDAMLDSASPGAVNREAQAMVCGKLGRMRHRPHGWIMQDDVEPVGSFSAGSHGRDICGHRLGPAN